MESKDYLTEDKILPKNQNFVCISFVSDPENKLTLKGVKVRGVFEKIEEASEHAKKIQSIDVAHNVFVGEVGKWLAFDPDVNSEAAGNAEYANEQLNSIMKSYGENQEKAKLFHEQRKFQNIQKSLQESLDTNTKKIDEIKEELLLESDKTKITDLTNSLENLNSQIKELEEKKKEYKKKEKKINKELEV